MYPTLTIVMYHYVRPIAESHYTGIRGLELAEFEVQLDHIARNYTVVSPGDVVAATRGEAALPQSPLLLTFDDGYADHYRYAFPILERRGMSAAFFPPVCAVERSKILDVNKVHFILACAPDLDSVITEIECEVAAAKETFLLEPVVHYRTTLRKPSRFDTADTIYVKRMLQVALPRALRDKIANRLFQKFVSADERDFADTLYMSEAELREMIAAGMTVGGHGDAHDWLDSLPVGEQANDIDRSLVMLRRLGALRPHFLFCFPYGAYTAETLALLEARRCAAAFTTKVALARVDRDSKLELPRIDTNDLPPRGSG